MKVVRGDTVEDQMKHVDVILSRMLRRMHKTVAVVNPPVPVFNYLRKPEEDGTILRAILPQGRIIRGFMYVGAYTERREVVFTAVLEGPSGGLSKDFATAKNLFIIDPDIPVEAGSRLRFFTHSPDVISDIWIGFLIQVAVRDSYKEQVILDALEETYASNEKKIALGEGES